MEKTHDALYIPHSAALQLTAWTIYTHTRITLALLRQRSLEKQYAIAGKSEGGGRVVQRRRARSQRNSRPKIQRRADLNSLYIYPSLSLSRARALALIRVIQLHAKLHSNSNSNSSRRSWRRRTDPCKRLYNLTRVSLPSARCTLYRGHNITAHRAIHIYTDEDEKDVWAASTMTYAHKHCTHRERRARWNILARGQCPISRSGGRSFFLLLSSLSPLWSSRLLL